MAKKSVLGRGLGALIDGADTYNNEVRSSINEVELSKIVANPYQPRTTFDEEALNELAASIKEIGIIQPITLRKVDDNHYQIIAGERRFRASKIAGLTAIPAYVRTADDEAMLEMALVENIQREDLDAIEIALSYQRLIEECKLTQEDLSDRVGKKRSTVTNYLRLLKLPAKIQKGIVEKLIAMGHARALVNIKDSDMQLMIYDETLKNDLSVRRVEEIVRNYNDDNASFKSEEKPVKEKFPTEYEDLKNHLNKFFHSKIDFRMDQSGKGKIVIPFTSTKDLERILGILDKLDA
ncbi:MAG TPA: chromosome partitioning protein ParB [Prolixibacteraceae bacterium]|jgi:ParB family chromosome partitioning protein|nr:chromosome partitioning protein ParB [Prolixibacteraceae bacterium]